MSDPQTDRPVIVGYTLKMNAGARDLIGDDLLMEQAREAFTHMHPGVEVTDQHWYYDEGGPWEDPETGEVYDVQPMWMLLTEGVKP